MADGLHNVVTYTLLSIPILLNILGIYCLWKQNRRQDNQKLFLYALSIVETFIVAIWIVLLSFDLSPPSNDNIVKVAVAAFGGVHIPFYLTMLFITLDRLLCVLLGIKYNYYITTKVIRRALYSSWVLGVGFVVPLYFADDEFREKVVLVYGFVVCDSIFVATAIIFYVFIAIALNKNRKILSPRLKMRRKIKKHHLIPAMLVTSFFLFYSIPDVILMTEGNEGLLPWFLGMVWSVGFMLDPIIYIFLHKKTRIIALDLLQCRKTGTQSQLNKFSLSFSRRKVGTSVNEI